MDKGQSKDLTILTGQEQTENLSGVFFNNIHYYDMSRVKYINHSGIADLIDLVKDWMEQGIEVKFINIQPEIRHEFVRLDLEHIIDFE